MLPWRKEHEAPSETTLTSMFVDESYRHSAIPDPPTAELPEPNIWDALHRTSQFPSQSRMLQHSTLREGPRMDVYDEKDLVCVQGLVNSDREVIYIRDRKLELVQYSDYAKVKDFLINEFEETPYERVNGDFPYPNEELLKQYTQYAFVRL